MVSDANVLPLLLRTLDARPEERDALLNTPQSRLFLLAPLRSTNSVEGLGESFYQFIASGTDCCSDELRDLGYLTFEAYAWSLA